MKLRRTIQFWPGKPCLPYGSLFDEIKRLATEESDVFENYMLDLDSHVDIRIKRLQLHGAIVTKVVPGNALGCRQAVEVRALRA